MAEHIDYTFRYNSDTLENMLGKELTEDECDEIAELLNKEFDRLLCDGTLDIIYKAISDREARKG